MFLKKLLNAFKFANDGIVAAIYQERNMKIHIFAALLTLLAAMALHFDKFDTLFILTAISLVLAAELFNSALEKTIDLVVKEYHPLAKSAKDMAAGSVLLLSFTAVLIGIVIAFPYIKQVFMDGWVTKDVHPPSFFVLEAFFIIIVTYVVKAFWYGKNKIYQPYISVAVLFFLVSVLSFLGYWFAYSLVLLSFIFIILYRKKQGFFACLQNAVISIGIFYILNLLFY